jgi:hypothetical protein
MTQNGREYPSPKVCFKSMYHKHLLTFLDYGQIEVIEHIALETPSIMSKDQLKEFMVSILSMLARKQQLIVGKSAKPPIDITVASTASKPPPLTAKDDLDEVANLKKDLALQRLLAESHLLDSSSNSSISGVNRHKATDLRLQSLGAKTSISRQEKMPMSHRKGIISKQTEREEKRRREARENGIILETVKGGIKGQKAVRRDRGIGGPVVGKFSGGTLRLSKKDIFDIEGPRKKFTSKGGRGRGRGRGGGAIRGSH